MPDATERLVNLALFLASAREPVSTEHIREEVAGYPADQDDAAFARMFERDKEALRETGLAIEATPDGLNRLDAAATFATEVSLSPTNAAVVRTVGAALLDDPAFPFADDLRYAITKVAALDASPAPALSRLVDEDPETQGAHVAELSAAATARKRVAFGYVNASGEARAREIEPYGLFVREGRWYAVGRDIELDEARVYAVSRMSDLVVNASKPKSPDFERPADFDVAAFIGLPFQYGPGEPFEVTLEFDPGVVWRAEGLTAGFGTLERNGTGDATTATWKVTARDRRHLLRWVVVNGPGIHIVSPEDLRGELLAGLAEVVDAHA